VLRDGTEIAASRIKVGDRVVISGEIGNHGIAILAERNGLSFDPPVITDSRPLNGLVRAMLNVARDIHFMRDPTRGGVSTTLKEAALECGLCIRLKESSLPIPPQVKGACGLLGLDPLYVANEGILIAILDETRLDAVISEMKSHPFGRNTAIIGEVVKEPSGMVLLDTPIGGSRIIDMLPGEMLPRIC
jgi:hydrogenase expression/formation protein HypE